MNAQKLGDWVEALFPWIPLVVGLALLLFFLVAYVETGVLGGWRAWHFYAIYAGVPLLECAIVALVALRSRRWLSFNTTLFNTTVTVWVLNVANVFASFYGIFGAY
jgi:hypothetical protein